MEFKCDGVKHQYAVYNERYSDHNEFYRIYFDKIVSGNGAFDFWGDSDAAAKIWDPMNKAAGNITGQTENNHIFILTHK